jgi:predicted GNAT family acetyltransferase
MVAQVTDNPVQHRFEMAIAPDAIAAAYYRLDGRRLVLIHTEVPSEFSGQGLATRLATGALDLIRQSGRKAVLKCPFMANFYKTHPEYADIVDG